MPVGEPPHYFDPLTTLAEGRLPNRHELDRALKALARGEDPAGVLEALSQGLTNKLLHAPTQALKKTK